MKKHILPKLLLSSFHWGWLVVGVCILGLGGTSFNWLKTQQQTQTQAKQIDEQTQVLGGVTQQLDWVTQQLASASAELALLQNRDELKINLALESELKSIRSTYQDAVKVYELLLKAKDTGLKTTVQDDQFTSALLYLSGRNYSSASAQLSSIQASIEKLQNDLAQVAIPASVISNNNPPGNGYQRQKVSSSIGDFQVDIIAGDLSTTKVIVDTASDSSCGNDCPVLSLGDYVARNNAYAAINGSYFCPASYPSCAGKTNSFDTLLMNKNKTYFNSDNNVYSTVPAVIFGGGWVRFVGQSLEWGRDTGIDSMIANQPLLVSGGKVVFGGDGDPKKGSRGNRSFVANKGNTVYIGVVRSATVAEVGHVLVIMGMENALNLDSGGSTALWSGGYKLGPGRNIPNAILFVKK